MINGKLRVKNVNTLIQIFDGTKQKNRSTLSASYTISDERRTSIIELSIKDPYARVCHTNIISKMFSDAHNRFTHYLYPIMKAIKINSRLKSAVSNMVMMMVNPDGDNALKLLSYYV